MFFTSKNNLQFTKNRYASITYVFIALVFILNLFTINQINRKSGNAGYEYTASSMPGYNAYSFTSSFNEVDNSPVEGKHVVVKNEVNTAAKKVFNNNVVRYDNIEEYALAESSPTDEVMDMDDSHIVPVTNVSPQETKEFIFNEENSAGSKVTKAYKMVLIDGKWIVQPLWMYTESKLRTDSLVLKVDSLPRPFNIIQ